jgi:hypothetical protein
LIVIGYLLLGSGREDYHCIFWNLAKSMKNRRPTVDKKAATSPSPCLSLHLEPADDKRLNVDAEQFFTLAERWLKSLKAFASDTGQHVKWEIVELKKASAFVQVRPVDAQSRQPLPSLACGWDKGLRELQKTGLPPQGFTQASLQTLQDFVRSVPTDSTVTLGDGTKKKKPFLVNAETQRRVEEAVAAASSTAPHEYSVRGKLRGRLAVLNSWNPEERSFRLQVTLAPGKPVNCTYRNEHLVNELGSGFEGVAEVDGLLHYRRAEVWPHRAEVDAIRVLAREQVTSLKDLVGILQLPRGQDSVSYVRSLRDAE